MAKVAELIEQARALEAQGESAKALAIYQHVLPHLEGMPAIKADLSLKAGDLMMKMGNKTGAIGMYEAAGTQCALHGSSKGVLTVASKIQEAAPDRSDILLSLAGQLVKHGHAGPAVDVLIQHAKQANLPEMLQELQPLAGRPSEDVRPQVQMLLEQPAPAAEPPPPPPPAPPSPEAQRDIADNFRMEPMSLEEQISSVPAPPPPLPRSSASFSAPPAPPPVAPTYAPPPPLPPVANLSIDVSPPLPPSPRETAAINLRASQAMMEAMKEPEVAPPPPPPRARASVSRRAVSGRGSRRGPGVLVLLAIPLVLVGAGAGLAYMGVLPPKVLPFIPRRAAGAPEPATDSVKATTPLPPRRAVPRRDTVPAPAPAPVRERPHAPRAGDAVANEVPPVRIEGLAVSDFSESPTGDRFRVIQRQQSGELLTLTGRPLADTIGEPAVGEIRLNSLPGDTAVAVTNFEGYIVTVRGRIAPTILQSLLGQLVARQ